MDPPVKVKMQKSSDFEFACLPIHQIVENGRREIACCIDLLFGAYKFLIQTFDHVLNNLKPVHTKFC